MPAYALQNFCTVCFKLYGMILVSLVVNEMCNVFKNYWYKITLILIMVKFILQIIFKTWISFSITRLSGVYVPIDDVYMIGEFILSKFHSPIDMVAPNDNWSWLFANLQAKNKFHIPSTQMSLASLFYFGRSKRWSCFHYDGRNWKQWYYYSDFSMFCSFILLYF